MNPWAESLLAVLAAGLGWWTARATRGVRHPWWLLGYLLPLTVILAFAVAVRRPDWALHPLLAWVFLGRWKFLVLAFVVASVFGTLVPRLAGIRERRALAVLVTLVVLYVAVWPCLAVAVNRPKLAALVTTLPADGVCRQSTDYTCGPAAAVTVLRRLGLPADEGELAVLARTSSASGTPPDVLTQTLNERFGADGLRAELRTFRSVEELRATGPTLVLIKFSLFLDHWVTVLAVTDREVFIGDPLSGPVTWSHDELARRWRQLGIVVWREPGR